MKTYFVYFACVIVLLISGACLKGRVPSDVVLPVSRIDSMFLTYFQQTSGVTAAEGTTSLNLSDGRVLWLFGSAHLNDYISATGMISCTPTVHNAAMTSNSSFVMTTLNVGVNDFIPSNETNTWFAPLHAYQYADTVFVFAKKMGGLQNNRTYVAKLHFPDLHYLQIDSFSFNNTNYGYTCFTDTAKGFCYVYGLFQPDILSTNQLYFARFPMNSLHDSWQFYSADRWVNLPSQATPIAQIPGENFSIRQVKNKFILLTQSAGKACNKGAEIYSQTSANPWGTFLNYQLLHTITDQLDSVSPVTYGVTLHPQFLNADNEVLITYAMNGYSPCISTCTGGYDNPEYYRIKALRVGLKKIDPAYK
jgi:hypothetical protein